MLFENFPLLSRIQENVRKSGYTHPTPIQEKAIPLILAHHDLLATAQTGTGKTAAFALPILHHLASEPAAQASAQPRCLILTPTRELAQQIYENFLAYGNGLQPRTAVIYGGVSQVPQIEALHRGCDILVACPGRLQDLAAQHEVSLSQVRIFVLDEADRMLDMGFIHDVRKIAGMLPVKRQTLLFSATMPTEVQHLAQDLLDHPREVHVDPVSSPARDVDQYMYYVDKANKKHLLAWLLSQPEVENALVFCRTKHGCDRIVRDLKKKDIAAVSIHGDKSQGARQNALNQFKTGQCRVMIATDIAARGLDIEGLSHVINYDLPNEPESYIHRIGRTGRAGHTGTAITMCCIDEVKQLGQVEKLLGFRLPEHHSDWPMQITTPTEKTQVLPHSRAAMPVQVTRQGLPVPGKNTHGRSRSTVTISRNGHPVTTQRSGLAQPVRRINRRKGSGT